MQPHIWGRKTGPRPLRLAGPRSPNFLRKGAQFFFQKRAKVVPKLGSFLVPDFGTTKVYVERLTPKSGTKNGPSFGTQNWPQVSPKKSAQSRPNLWPGGRHFPLCMDFKMSCQLYKFTKNMHAKKGLSEGKLLQAVGQAESPVDAVHAANRLQRATTSHPERLQTNPAHWKLIVA